MTPLTGGLDKGPLGTRAAVVGRIVAEHPRSFGRGETTYDPWHYVPVLARKPGALRNGAPFKGLGAAIRDREDPAQARQYR